MRSTAVTRATLAAALLAIAACGSGLDVDASGVNGPGATSTPGAEPAPGAPVPPPVTPPATPPAAPPTAGAPPAPATPPPATPPPAGGSSILQLDVLRAGARPQVSTMALDVRGIALYVGQRPPPPVHGEPCDVAGAQWYDVTARVPLDLDDEGASPVARLETAATGDVAEIRLFLRGEVQRRGRRHELDGRETCVAGDGWDVAVLRIHPATRVSLAGGRDYRLVVPFDARDIVSEERIACGAGPLRVQVHDPDGPDECRQGEDDDDDRDDRTRLRYVLAGEATCAVEEQGR
jgi:hypothetical protein